MSPDPHEETKEAFRWALDTGNDMSHLSAEEHLQEKWEQYIEEQVHLAMWEEDRLPDDPDNFIVRMKECADDVADELDVSATLK